MQEPDLMAIFSRRNPEEVRKRANARNQIIKIEKARLLAALKAEGGETLDRAVVSIWEELDKLYEENIRFFNADELGKDKPDPAEKVNVRFEDWDKKRKALLTPMSARMGQVEFKDGKPKPGSLTYSVAMGGLQRQKQLLASQYLTFHNPSQGLPALAEWLCKQGCQVRYEIKTSPADLNDPDSDNDEREQPKE
jgi:hypothetical protein